MAPPFIAYYGALKSNRTLLLEAYKQCSLYRNALRDPRTGLWKHIVGGNWQDNNLWATGASTDVSSGTIIY
jgi:rhamnogalacturonyl hydrolase YesR